MCTFYYYTFSLFHFRFGSFLPKTHKCKSCRARQELSNEYTYRTNIYLQKSASIQPSTSLAKFACSKCHNTDICENLHPGLRAPAGRRCAPAPAPPQVTKTATKLDKAASRSCVKKPAKTPVGFEPSNLGIHC